MSRAPRTLRPEEKALWWHVTESVRPLRPGSAPPAPVAPAETAATATDALTPPPAEQRPPAPAFPPLAPLERVLKRRVARGSREVDATLDLHGMRQAEAHGALLRFIHRSQQGGAVVVLVVTGKGQSRARGRSTPGSWESSDSGGVLRRLVPHWLSEPSLRACVVGYEEAPQTRGGGGALLVRIRRAKIREF